MRKSLNLQKEELHSRYESAMIFLRRAWKSPKWLDQIGLYRVSHQQEMFRFIRIAFIWVIFYWLFPASSYLSSPHRFGSWTHSYVWASWRRCRCLYLMRFGLRHRSGGFGGTKPTKQPLANKWRQLATRLKWAVSHYPAGCRKRNGVRNGEAFQLPSR